MSNMLRLMEYQFHDDDRVITQADEWPLTYFTPGELRSPGELRFILHVQSIHLLDQLREEFGQALYCHSGYRTEEHNAAVGGVANSFHRKGMAFDIRWPSVHAQRKREFLELAMSMFNGVGIYKNFVHLDTGPMRLWVGGGYL